MRMWMVDPRILCSKHLLGEHVETHMFAGSIRKGLSMQGYIDAGLLEVRSLFARHEALVKEMKRRGMVHSSPLFFDPRSEEARRWKGSRVDREASLEELLRRCKRCEALAAGRRGRL